MIPRYEFHEAARKFNLDSSTIERDYAPCIRQSKIDPPRQFNFDPPLNKLNVPLGS